MTGSANTENTLASTFSSLFSTPNENTSLSAFGVPSSTHPESTLSSSFTSLCNTHPETTTLSTFDGPSSTHTENTFTSSSTRPSTPSSISSEGSEYLERWDEDDVKLLIACYSEMKHLFGKGKNTKRDVFSKIAFSFNKQSNTKMVTGDQCLRKWSKLESTFKKVEDHNKKTGNNKKTMKYYDEIQACIGSDPNIKPVISLESGHVSADDSSGDESGELSSADGKPKKRPVRKRKSHSSAAEMLEFMNRYAEKREKVEEEKLNLMKEMQNDKKMFLSEYLEIMRKK